MGRLWDVFGAHMGRTEVIIGVFKAKFCEELHGSVRFCLGPQKPGEIDEKRNFRDDFFCFGEVGGPIFFFLGRSAGHFFFVEGVGGLVARPRRGRRRGRRKKIRGGTTTWNRR